jgi:hypothetical protein
MGCGAIIQRDGRKAVIEAVAVEELRPLFEERDRLKARVAKLEAAIARGFAMLEGKGVALPVNVYAELLEMALKEIKSAYVSPPPSVSEPFCDRCPGEGGHKLSCPEAGAYVKVAVSTPQVKPEATNLNSAGACSSEAKPYTRELQAILENAVDATPRLAEAIDAHREAALAAAARTETARPFQVGDVITFMQAARFRLDAVAMRDGKQVAEMTLLVDDLGYKGEWKQLGGPCSLKDAVLVVPTGSEER